MAWGLVAKLEGAMRRPRETAAAREEAHSIELRIRDLRRTLDEIFPWEHIDIAVTKKFLSKDYLMSQNQETRIDCRHQCFACGILPKLKDLRRETPPEAWQCPPVRQKTTAKRSEAVT